MEADAERPVRYVNGEIRMAVTDISSGGFGDDLGHTRIYSNRLCGDFDFGNGNNWLVRQSPYLFQQGNTIVVMRGTRSTLWFDFDLVSRAYAPRYGASHTLTHDSANQVFNLVAPNGTLTTFNDFAAVPAGAFKSQATPGGQVTRVVSYHGFQVAEIQRSYQEGAGSSSSSSSSSSGAGLTVESYLYTYSGGSFASVLLRRQVDGGAWTNVEQVTYAYYGLGDAHGSPGDLQTATVQFWNETAWQTKGTWFYRYWLDVFGSSSSSSSSGAPYSAAGLLKFALNPDAYARLSGAVGNPLTASDSQVAEFADFYFEYDSERHVTKEVVDAGLHTYTFSYTENSNSGYLDAYNNWRMKTIETRPDGATMTVYTNYIGQPLLTQLASGGESWTTAVTLDGAGNVIQNANRSAVAGFDDTQNNLGVSLHASSGLIHLYQYYPLPGSGGSSGFGSSFFPSSSSSSSSSSSGPSGEAPGYLKAVLIKQGSQGTPVLLRSLTYTSSTADGITIYALATDTVYRNDDGTGAATTGYTYTFYAGTNAVSQRDTTWPVVSTAQNGSGFSAGRVEQFDQFGNTTWLKDERGFLIRMAYDLVTGAVSQRIDDVDTTQVSDAPPYWTTPVGGGLHLVTDFQFDAQGRTTQVLGPSHTVDLGGVATAVRTATWTVYQDATRQVWTAQGFATGAAPSYSFTLVNPVSIAIFDEDGRMTDQVSAIRASTSGALSASDSFPQSSYCRWTHNIFDDQGQLTASQVYFAIPASGSGFVGTNFNETDFGYDVIGRQNKVVSPGGTITRTVFDARNLALSVYVGTNVEPERNPPRRDNGATDTDPTGGGATGNNMVAVQLNQYDGGLGAGDGNLTQQTVPVDSNSADNRVTTFQFDWRNRQTQVNAPQDFYVVNTFDTLDRVTQIQQFSQTTNKLINQSATKFDDRGRVYQSVRYAVDPTTGTVGNTLTDNSWFDPSSNVLCQLPAGSNTFVKVVFDGLGRDTARYVGYFTGQTSYSWAASVANDTIMEQVETIYDEASNAIQTTSRQRFHNATGTGPLTAPGGAQPVARVTYVAPYPDAVGRNQAMADYGTNGDVALVRSATVPASSASVLVSTTVYASDGTASQSVDPAGTVTAFTVDQAGRQTQVVENYRAASSSSSSSSGGLPTSDDANVTTQWTFNADSLVATLTAVNAETGNQTTSYTYGTTLASSDIARSDHLASITYPDLGVVSYLFNRQGQVKQFTDQRLVVHAYSFDLLGRLVQDRVTSFLSSCAPVNHS